MNDEIETEATEDEQGAEFPATCDNEDGHRGSDEPGFIPCAGCSS
jgi:hypothetical protein